MIKEIIMYVNSFWNFFPKQVNVNWLSHYSYFIESRTRRVLKEDNIKYTESHHIVPKCYLPKELWKDKSNIIELTPREHFISHFLLWKAFGGKMTYAFNRMVNSNQNGNKQWITSRQYELLKREYRIQASISKKGHSPINKGKKLSEEECLKMSNIQKEVWKREGYAEKMSLAHKNQIVSEETKNKISTTLKGRPSPMKGKIHTQKSRDKLSKSLKEYWKDNEEAKERASLLQQERMTEERRKEYSEKYKGRKPWNTGKEMSPSFCCQVGNRARYNKYASGNKPWLGRKLSEEHKESLSKSHKDKIWVNNGFIKFLIKREELPYYLQFGMIQGRGRNNSNIIHVDKEYIDKVWVYEFLALNPNRGERIMEGNEEKMVQFNEQTITQEELAQKMEHAENSPDVTIIQTGKDTYKQKVTG